MQISSVGVSVPRQSKISNKTNLNFKATYKDFYSSKRGLLVEVNQKRINLASDDSVHLRDVGEHLRTTEDKLIRDKFAVVSGFLGGKSERKSEEAYRKIMPYVQAARIKYDGIVKELAYLRMFGHTRADMQRIRELEKMRTRMDFKADDAMKYTDSFTVCMPEDRTKQHYAELDEFLSNLS